jgi:endoglucanase
MRQWLRAAATAGGILFLGTSIAARAQNPQSAAALWQAYAGHFLSQDGRVIDPQGGDRTTSEGQSYAMFFALANNDRARFDQILAWTEQNLADNRLGAHLPAWEWGKRKDASWGKIDVNSAADSDLWIAYDLLEAGRLWKEPKYTAIGKRMLPEIARRETATLSGFGPVLLPGEYGFHLKSSWILNPCYTPLFLLERLAKVDPAGPWSGIARKQSELIANSSPVGFTMDWVSYTPGVGFAPSLANAVKSDGAVGSYDAIRVYLWAGMTNEEQPERGKILESLHGMSEYLKNHDGPPEKVDAMGKPMATEGPVGFSAAVLPFLAALSESDAVSRQMQRIESQLDEKTGLYGKVPTYYDQNLILFGMGWMQKQFRFSDSGDLIVSWQHR